MSRAVVAIVCAGLVACGGSKRPPAPEAAAICAGTTPARGAHVLSTSDPSAGGKARGLRELASRTPAGNAVALAELDRFISASDAASIFDAHTVERERKVREELESARGIAQTIPPEAWPPGPLSVPAATSTAAKVAELTKPLVDGSALAAVTERARALSTTLDDLAAKLAALEAAPEVGQLHVPIAEAIKIANVAHGKLNEAVAAFHTNASSLAALADEQDGRRFAEAVRLRARLATAAARLAEPWPTTIPPPRQRAFMIAGPRQWVVTCAAPRPSAPPPGLVAARASLLVVRDALGTSLGHPPIPATGVALPPLATLIATLDAALAR